MDISFPAIENGLWRIQRYLIYRRGLTVSESERAVAPLAWYVATGRASADFLRRMLTAKPFMLARKLTQGGSDDEILRRIKKYLGYIPDEI